MCTLSILISNRFHPHHHHPSTQKHTNTTQSTNRSFFNGGHPGGMSSGSSHTGIPAPTRSTSSSLPRSVAMDLLGQGRNPDPEAKDLYMNLVYQNVPQPGGSGGAGPAPVAGGTYSAKVSDAHTYTPSPHTPSAHGLLFPTSVVLCPAISLEW